MIKIVKNQGQCKHLAGRCKYLFYMSDFGMELYAKPGLKPLCGYILAKIREGVK